MKKWVLSKLRYLDELAGHPELQPCHFDELRTIVAQATRKAAQVGIAVPRVRQGPISIDLCRSVLAGVLAEIKPTSDLMTVAEAAEKFNVSKRTLYREIKGGNLPCERIRGTIRIRPADLERHLAPRPAPGSLFD
jgi:excisionase family DNA binding protein